MSSPATVELRTGLDHAELASLLRLRVAEKRLSHSFIHEADPYSAAPPELVKGREHAPGDDGKGMVWYFCWPAECHGTASKRKRKVAAAGETTYWHPETGKQAIIAGTDGDQSVGAYKRTLSYVHKIRNPPGTATTFTRKRLGWCMLEIGLDGPDQRLVLCKLYRPHQARAHPGEVSVAGGVMPCPAPAPAPLAAEIPVSRVAIVRNGSPARAAVTVVIDLCGSSIPPAQWLKGMANFVHGLESPAVVVSAMGNTTTTILLAAWKALRCGPEKVCEIHEVLFIKELYLRMTVELGLETSAASGSLDLLEHQLQHVAMTKKLTPCTRDYLIYFGEITSTKIFSKYLNNLEGTLQVWKLHTIATSGRGSTNLTATTIERALESSEIEVWKDVDGIFSCDPKVCADATLVPHLSFDEAAELSDFAEQSMKQAMEYGISVRVRNPYKLQVHGTVITKTRDMSEFQSALTSIVLKSNITILDIKSKRMLVPTDFVPLAFSKFQQFEYLGIYVDCKVTIDGKMSLTLVPSELLSRELIKLELDNVVQELQKIAEVHRVENVSVISLIGNTRKSSSIQEKALSVLRSIDVEVHKFSQESSKEQVMKSFLVVDKSRAKDCVQALHSAFFEKGLVSEVGEAENVPQVVVWQESYSSVPGSIDGSLLSDEFLSNLIRDDNELMPVEVGPWEGGWADVDEDFPWYNGAYGGSVPTAPKACPVPRADSSPHGNADRPVGCMNQDHVVPNMIKNVGKKKHY